MAAALHPGWAVHLGAYFERPDMQALAAFLRAEKAAGKRVHPPGRQMFAALDAVPFDAVRVVILGQDPYHGPGQAHGLSFSVPPGIAIPPSLLNIFKEIERDLGLPMPRHGCLQHWAAQGVLLLNAVLSVEEGRAGSHAGKGWEGFTDAIIGALSREREGLVFLLWGSYAQKKGELIDRQRHCVLKAPHPSPLSAHRGFLGCGHFGKANRWLQGLGSAPIDWSLPPA
ncbi:uracil-DNA glycosylase [Silanimonas sp.]|jgi:uracil-DNA glycosylase|uniref:uracil-DNA glycosylase n=1 Tax=Silanimonas sp. TaxID=1929290 RepID=UPI0037C6A0EF